MALTFLFGFGNVLTLRLRLGVPVWVASLVAPAVDLSVVGLLIAIRSLSLQGAPAEVIRPARRLLLASSVVTLALNVAEPLIAGEVGRALFDAVGPLLLIGWAEVGPVLLQALASVSATGSQAGPAEATDSSCRSRHGMRIGGIASCISVPSLPRVSGRCWGWGPSGRERL